jgi:hypothetical protein
MNQDLLNQLNSSNLSNDDIQNLLKALGQTSLGKGKGKGKGLKMTAQDKNNLLSKLSNVTQSNVEKEDITKNMTEEEKKNYHREELRRKLREKQGKLNEARFSKTVLQKKYNDNLKKMQPEQVVQPEQVEKVEQTEQTEKVEQAEQEQEEKLEDFMNNN